MLTLTGVAKTFFRGTPAAVRALDAVTLTVAPGDFVQIIGSNGAGKSTLLKVVAGTVTLDAGRVELDGRDITQAPDYLRARDIGRIAQDPADSTCGGMSVEENLAMAARRGQPRRLRRGVSPALRKAFAEQLHGLGLALEHRLKTPVATLSGGQRQALALLMATMGTPKVVLLDEHLASLDPATAETVMTVTSTLLTSRRLTSLMVTHNMEHAIRSGNRLVMMHAGRIVCDLAGEDKRALTVEGLVRRFRDATHNELTLDRMRLV